MIEEDIVYVRAIRRCPICIHNAYVDCDNTILHACFEDITLIVDLILMYKVN